MDAKQKTILILSPQPFTWQVSKRHYAEALANMGHQVFFMEPPTVTSRFKVRLNHVEGMLNVSLVEVGIPLPDRIRLRMNRGPQVFLYEHLMRLIANKISKELPPLDYLISFDNTLFFPSPAAFGAERSVLMIMDALGDNGLRRMSQLAQNVDCLGAVAGFFLSPFKNLPVKTQLFHHGLGKAFELLAKDLQQSGCKTNGTGDKIHVGFVGNLTRAATNYEQLEQIITCHPDLIFEFWGPDGYAVESRADLMSRAQRYLTFLDSQPNVIRHGMVKPSEIADASERIDIWLACYDYRDDVNADETGVSNSHKIMEYLATGKVIVSNLFTMYIDVAELLAMMPTPSNDGFADHFSSVVDGLDDWNRLEIQQRRIDFALSNTYENQAEHLLSLLEGLDS